MASDGGAVARRIKVPPRRVIGVSLALVAVAAVLVLALRGGHGSATKPAPAEGSAKFADVAELRSLAGSVGHAIYWAGSLSGEKLELTSSTNGDVYLRYLPPGVEAGDPDPSFLTIGTYPVTSGEEALSAAAAESGSTLRHIADGGLVLVSKEDPTSAYLAYPGSELELEIYDPAPGAALGLIESGKIRPVG